MVMFFTCDYYSDKLGSKVSIWRQFARISVLVLIVSSHDTFLCTQKMRILQQNDIFSSENFENLKFSPKWILCQVLTLLRFSTYATVFDLLYFLESAWRCLCWDHLQADQWISNPPDEYPLPLPTGSLDLPKGLQVTLAHFCYFSIINKKLEKYFSFLTKEWYDVLTLQTYAE